MFGSRLRTNRLLEVRRRGKYLMARVDKGGCLTLHFGMTATLQFVHKPDTSPFHQGMHRFRRPRAAFEQIEHPNYGRTPDDAACCGIARQLMR